MACSAIDLLAIVMSIAIAESNSVWPPRLLVVVLKHELVSSRVLVLMVDSIRDNNSSINRLNRGIGDILLRSSHIPDKVH